MASEDRTQDYNDDLKRMSNKLGIPTPQSIETPITETSQLSQILSGWGNRIKDTFGILDEETKLIGFLVKIRVYEVLFYQTCR